MKSVATLVFALCSSTTLFAQIGDKPGEDQVAVVPDHLIPAAPAPSPEDELKTFRATPETVQQLRDTTSTRTDAWTEPELLQLP